MPQDKQSLEEIGKESGEALKAELESANKKSESHEGPRKFYVTDISLRVLSEGPLGDISLKQIVYEIDEGDCVGATRNRKEREVSGKVMARLLEELGSEPGFFQLDSNGKDQG